MPGTDAGFTNGRYGDVPARSFTTTAPGFSNAPSYSLTHRCKIPLWSGRWEAGRFPVHALAPARAWRPDLRVACAIPEHQDRVGIHWQRPPGPRLFRRPRRLSTWLVYPSDY